MPLNYQGKTATAGQTVRQRIVDALELTLSQMQDDGADAWKHVFRGDLDVLDNTATPCASIDFGMEEMLNNTFPCSYYRLPIFFNFRFTGQRGLDEHDVYMYYLGLLQAAMLGDHNVEGLTVDVKEIGNTHTIVGVEGVYPGGTLMVDVYYKTRLHDPYRMPHEA